VVYGLLLLLKGLFVTPHVAAKFGAAGDAIGCVCGFVSVVVVVKLASSSKSGQKSRLKS